MTARVINDPSALGWEYDSETGRWSWGGGQGSSGDGGSFPEAPVDGEQYSRQNAGWAVIVHPEGGTGGTVTTADVQLTNPTRMPDGLTTQEDANGYVADALSQMIEDDAPSDSMVYGRKNNDWVVVPTGSGGGDVDLSGYYTAAQCDAKFQPKGNYLTSGSLNGYATQTWVSTNYQPKGDYLTGFTETDPVFKASPAGTITQAMINNWNNAGSGATPTLQQVTDAGATTTKNMTANTYFTQSDSWTIGKSSGARIFCSNGNISLKNSGGHNTLAVSAAGDVTATQDVTAFSDVRLKENIETLDGSKVYQMRGVSFTKDGRDGSGVIAQELQQIAPELVRDDGEYLSVAYGNLVGYLIEAVKELRAEVEELKGA